MGLSQPGMIGLPGRVENRISVTGFGYFSVISSICFHGIAL